MLDAINTILSGFASEFGFEKVFYGAASDRSGKLKHWNYIIFRRLHNSGDAVSVTDFFEIVVVHEDYIPEGITEKLIRKLREGGFKISGNVEYDFDFKNGTDLGVEAAAFTVTKTRKGCKA